MASGWANDDAVNEQINNTIEDAVARALAANFLTVAKVAMNANLAATLSPEARRKAVPGVRLGISCQQEKDFT